MGIISNANFMDQQALLGSGYAFLEQVEPLVYSGLELVILSNDVDVLLALTGPYQTSDTNADPLRTASVLRDAIVALERHITDQSGQTFNDWLYAQGLKVAQSFADLSAAVGTPIVPQNIAT